MHLKSIAELPHVLELTASREILSQKSEVSASIPPNIGIKSRGRKGFPSVTCIKTWVINVADNPLFYLSCHFKEILR